MMNQYGALVRKDSMAKDDKDLFARCTMIFQQIGWTLDKWQDTVRNIRPNLRRREPIVTAEMCLRETEQRIWQLFYYGKMDGAAITGGGDIGGHSSNAATNLVRHSPPMLQQANQPAEIDEHVVHLQKHVAVAVTRCDGVQTAITSAKVSTERKRKSQEKALENLLCDWYVALDEDYLLRLEGVLLNEGHWKTTPIATRVGPTTLKTTSGTIYNINGTMFIPENEDIPDFIQEKFHNGFPSDWEVAVHQWHDYKAKRKRLADQESAMLPQCPPSPVLKRSQMTAATQNTKMRSNDQNMMPPPIQNGQRKEREESLIRQKPVERKERSISENVEKKVVGVGNGQRAASPNQRFSKRVLNRTLESMDGTLNTSQDVSADIILIKKWSVEVYGETGELILFGQLVDDKGNILDRNFFSASITHRLKCDLIQTADGEIYRLIGPSVLSKPKSLDFGFPVGWKQMLKRGGFPVRPVERTHRASKTKDNSYARVTNDTRMNYSTRSATLPTGGPKRSSMIQHLVRHRLNEGRTSMSDSRASQSKDKNASLQSKRKVEVPALPQNSFAPLKKKRSDENNKSSEGTTTRNTGKHNLTSQDVSFTSEQNWKSSIVADWKKAKQDVAGEGKSTVNGGESKKNDDKTSEAVEKKVKRKRNTTQKYLSGLLSENGPDDFDFNIF